MLVLSRRQGERILFPDLDISVEVSSVKGPSVRLGIEAPREVTIIREEIAADANPSAATKSRKHHDLRGRLNTLAMALHVAEKQMKAGLTADAESTLHEAQVVLEKLSSEATPPPHVAAAKPIEALLVEDNLNEETLLSNYLRLSGFCVKTAHDGYEALEFLADHQRPDFLLIDMRLPRLGGPETIAAIRQNPAYHGLRIFAVTGSSPAEVDVSIGEQGVDAWFQKPINPKRIVEAMNATISIN